MGARGPGRLGYDHGYDAEVFYLGLALDEMFVEGCLERIGKDDSDEEDFLQGIWEERFLQSRGGRENNHPATRWTGTRRRAGAPTLEQRGFDLLSRRHIVFDFIDKGRRGDAPRVRRPFGRIS